ncbi:MULTISPECIES: Maf family protein [unclassified Halomonas]|uniref:Maf family protein n=1 Tax=unclassified Halomonas TaxID=2609666 RepID=UPI0021E3C0A4|nr:MULTISPECIES: Maf family protein [unclassified Halomonas]UYF98568.1 Maf family nucleotide pyrophosphatase [Halomonas sp. GD1P12]WNL40318.1 Maf family protein [Halomonas sp. PAMB 3232]WNL43649.1 Maf family protein [Halomonas sp. PAMB 3264]
MSVDGAHRAPTLCLASASPRRKALLASIGVAVEVRASNIDETPLENESAHDYVERLAIAKARACFGATGLAVLGSDTAVVLDGRVLGKPESAAHGREMLAALSSRTHQVMTGVAVIGPAGTLSTVVTTEVRMRAISDAEIARYWETGEPWDKAGGYAIQGLASVFVEEIRGSHSAVVGLPLFETAALLSRQGVSVWSARL